MDFQPYIWTFHTMLKSTGLSFTLNVYFNHAHIIWRTLMLLYRFFPMYIKATTAIYFYNTFLFLSSFSENIFCMLSDSYFCQNSFLLIENKHLFHFQVYLRLLIKITVLTKTMKLWLLKKYSAPLLSEFFLKSFWNIPVYEYRNCYAMCRRPMRS